MLALLAIPKYSAEKAKDQAREGLQNASSLKAAVSEYKFSKGEWPISNAAAGVQLPNEYRGRYVSTVSVGEGGVITIQMKSTGVESALEGKKILLTPTAEGASILWACTNNLDYGEQDNVPHNCPRAR